jgi:hypothetical protein
MYCMFLNVVLYVSQTVLKFINNIFNEVNIMMKKVIPKKTERSV